MKGKRNTSTEYKKRKFLEYYSGLPIIKLACDNVNIDPNTATNWQKDDEKFCEAMRQARATWAETHAHGVRNHEWLLERIMSEHFRQVSEIEYGATNEVSEALDRLAKILSPKR
jgi:hypothetical protein